MYAVTFPAPDTYYVYIDDEKQYASIMITDKNYTSKVTSISPNIVTFGSHTFIITVDTNLGINEVYIQLYNTDNLNTIYVRLYCEPYLLYETKAICNANFPYKGEYNLMFNTTKIDNLNVSVKDAPKLGNFFPFSFSPSSNTQIIIFYFEEDVSNYFNNVTFVGAETETIYPSCNINSNYVLNCSAVFNKEDKYYITLDGVNIGSFINVNEKDNIVEEDIYEEEEINENESSNGKNEINDKSDSNKSKSNNNENDDSNDDDDNN